MSDIRSGHGASEAEKRASDRRASDRREAQQPFDGTDRRQGSRRSDADRRAG